MTIANNYTRNMYSMLSKDELQNLFLLGKNLKLNTNDCILEYGVFFGGSIEALYSGLKKNPTFDKQKIIGVDAFYASKKGDFYNLVLTVANEINIKNKLLIKPTYIDWYQYVENSFIKYKEIKLVKASPKTFQLDKDINIVLLHLDMPKFYIELRNILLNITNNLRYGTVILFQDYFYHWSAEIIAFGYFLIKNNIIKYDNNIVNTLTTSNISFNINDLKSFDLIIDNKLHMLTLLIESISYFKDKVNVHKLSILYMAIVQYSYINNFKKEFIYYLELIDTIYSNNQDTRNLINYMRQDVEKYNYDVYKNYKSTLIGFKC